MTITINNEKKETQAATIAALAQEMALPEKGIAIASDNKIIPRTEWAERAVTEGMSLVIIKAFCGG